MNVKFTVDYDLIELVDAIGLDYKVIDDEIEINCKDVDDSLSLLRDEDLCEYVLNPELCEGLIYTDRSY